MPAKVTSRAKARVFVALIGTAEAVSSRKSSQKLVSSRNLVSPETRARLALPKTLATLFFFLGGGVIYFHAAARA
jgi:hypothetical protein